MALRKVRRNIRLLRDQVQSNIHHQDDYHASMFNIPVNIPVKRDVQHSYTVSELKSRFGPEFRAMIQEAEEQGREIGAMICQLRSGQPHLSRTCYGSRATVNVADCHDGRPLGSFHVHLHGTNVFSVPDLEQAIKKESISCIGYTKNGIPLLKCVMPRRYYEYDPRKKAEIQSGLIEARRNIERATQLFQSDTFSPEAITLSQRAKAMLLRIEQYLGSYETEL